MDHKQDVLFLTYFDLQPKCFHCFKLFVTIYVLQCFYKHFCFLRCNLFLLLVYPASYMLRFIDLAKSLQYWPSLVSSPQFYVVLEDNTLVNKGPSCIQSLGQYKWPIRDVCGCLILVSIEVFLYRDVILYGFACKFYTTSVLI